MLGRLSAEYCYILNSINRKVIYHQYTFEKSIISLDYITECNANDI